MPPPRGWDTAQGRCPRLGGGICAISRRGRSPRGRRARGRGLGRRTLGLLPNRSSRASSTIAARGRLNRDLGRSNRARPAEQPRPRPWPWPWLRFATEKVRLLRQYHGPPLSVVAHLCFLCFFCFSLFFFVLQCFLFVRFVLLCFFVFTLTLSASQTKLDSRQRRWNHPTSVRPTPIVKAIGTSMPHMTQGGYPCSMQKALPVTQPGHHAAQP